MHRIVLNLGHKGDVGAVDHAAKALILLRLWVKTPCPVQFRVSESTRDLLERIAAARAGSVSKLSRQVLDEFVEAHRSEVVQPSGPA